MKTVEDDARTWRTLLSLPGRVGIVDEKAGEATVRHMDAVARLAGRGRSRAPRA